MSSELGYYRHPTIARDDVVFVCEDDLWKVSADGGTARRLTANPGVASFPVFSPDGESVAFTGRDDGPTEVYVMAADGGRPRRLTWLGSHTQVVGWTPGGRILASTDWRQPFAGTMHLISVSETGAPPESLPCGPARAASFAPGSEGLVIGRNSGDPARWKRYRGGTAGTLWIDRGGTGEFSPLIRLEGNLASPMWIGSRIYFLSDHEGHGNLYSCTPTGRGLRQHTHHADFYVRFPSTDGSRIVYHSGRTSTSLIPRVVGPERSTSEYTAVAASATANSSLRPAISNRSTCIPTVTRWHPFIVADCSRWGSGRKHR